MDFICQRRQNFKNAIHWKQKMERFIMMLCNLQKFVPGCEPTFLKRRTDQREQADCGLWPGSSPSFPAMGCGPCREGRARFRSAAASAALRRPLSSWGCSRPRFVLLEQRVPQGGNANVVSSYLLCLQSGSAWRWEINCHFQAVRLDVPTTMTELANPLPSFTSPLLDPHGLGEKVRKKQYTEQVLIALP